MKQKILRGTILLIILGIIIYAFKETIVSVNFQKKNVKKIIKNKSIAVEESSNIKNIYYISATGKSLEGKSPDDPMPLETANKMKFTTKDKILFKKGDVFFGQINFSIDNIDDESLVYIGSYGDGEMPIISVSKIIDNMNSWEEYEKSNIYRVDLTDYSKFYGLRENDENSCNVGFWKDEKGRIYGSAKKNLNDLKNEGDFFCDGKYFYLKSSINPKSKYGKISLSTKYDNIRVSNNTEIDGIRIEFSSSHAIAKRTYPINNVYIHNCKILDIGGSFQYGLTGTSTTRYGNAIEFWCGASNVLIENNLIANVYDACITLQGTDGEFSDILIQNNILLNSCYPFELWASQDAKSMNNITICNNYIINQGRGWGQEVRKNPYNSANFVFYEFSENVKINIEIYNNYFINSLREYYILNSTKERLLKYMKIYCNKYFYNSDTFVLNDLKENVEYYLIKNNIDENSTFKLLTDTQIEQISNTKILNSNDYNEIKQYYENLEEEFSYDEIKQPIVDNYNKYINDNTTTLAKINNATNDLNNIKNKIENTSLNTLNEDLLKEIIEDIYTIEVNTLKANIEAKITNEEMAQTINNLNGLARQIDNIYNKAGISNKFEKQDIEKYINQTQSRIESQQDLNIENLELLLDIEKNILEKENTTYADYLYVTMLDTWSKSIIDRKIEEYISENTVEIVYSEQELTNRDVIATIKTNANINIINNSNSKTYTFKENGTFLFEYEIKGRKLSIQAKVTNIDKKPPEITGIELEGQYKQSVKPQITDENLSEVKLIKDGQEVENYQANTTIAQEGIYQLIAKDKAGNETTINFVIAYLEDEKIKIENNTIKNIKGETKVIELKEKLQVSTAYTIKRQNTEIEDTENIATGDILEIEDGTQYTLIVKGDINKDGKVDVKDLVKMRRYLLLGNNLDENEKIAADTNLDGKEISVRDLVKMRIILLTSNTNVT